MAILLKLAILGAMFLASAIVHTPLRAQENITLELIPPTPGMLQVPLEYGITITNPARGHGGAYITADYFDLGRSDVQPVAWARTQRFVIRAGRKTFPTLHDSILTADAEQPYRNAILSGLGLPPGTYRLCLHLHDSSGAVLAEMCTATLTVPNVAPPQLRSPANGATTLPVVPEFEWKRPAGLPPGTPVQYTVTITDVRTGESPLTAIRNHPDLMTISAKGGAVLRQRCPVSLLPLNPSKTYVWQVAASWPVDSGRFEHVHSELRTFTPHTQIPAPGDSAYMADVEISIDVATPDFSDAGTTPETYPDIRYQEDTLDGYVLLGETPGADYPPKDHAIDGWFRFALESRTGGKARVTLQPADASAPPIALPPMSLRAGRNRYAINLRQQPGVVAGRRYTLVVAAPGLAKRQLPVRIGSPASR